MKIGLTSYSMNNYICDGIMSVCEVMRFAKSIGAEHIELVPFGFTLHDDKTGEFNEPLIAEIRRVSEEIDLPLSNYAVLGDLLRADPDARHAEVERLKRHIDVAAKLGLKTMRHDVSSFRRPLESNTPIAFEKEFPLAVETCRELADYASQYGITTLVENHGFFVNGSDRVIRLIDAVDRENFGLLLDTGNFTCVDENPTVAVKKCAPIAKMVHLKDFYIRRADRLTRIHASRLDPRAGRSRHLVDPRFHPRHRVRRIRVHRIRGHGGRQDRLRNRHGCGTVYSGEQLTS